MRILLVSESFPPVISGVSITVSRIAAGMAERGHEVAVLTPSQDGDTGVSLVEAYTVYYVPSVSNPFRKGLRFSPFGRGAARALKDFKPDIVHVHDVAALCKAAATAAGHFGVPVVATHHFMAEGLVGYVPAAKLVSPVFLSAAQRAAVSLYSRCRKVLVPTEYMRDYLDSWEAISTDIDVISNGVDMERFRPADALPEVCTFGYVGRLDPEKNLDVLLQAAAVLKERGVRFKLEMVGSGNKADLIDERIVELDLGEHVARRLPLPYGGPELPEAYRSFTAFCIPSPAETESMVTLEAMASGLPIIGANSGALVELVSQENGIPVQPDDVDAWVAALEAVTGMDPNRLAAWGEASRTKAEARSLPACMSKLERLYEETVS